MNPDEIKIRKLKRKDLPQLLDWGNHEEIIFEPYNFPRYDRFELVSWYMEKKSLFKKRIFGIFIDEQLIGFMTLKNINYKMKTSEMGIVLNPDIVSNGFGTGAILKLIDYVKMRTSINKIWLKTAEFNYRAIRCYDKCGFKISQRIFVAYESQNNIEKLLREYEYFTYKDGEIYTHYLIMERSII